MEDTVDKATENVVKKSTTKRRTSEDKENKVAKTDKSTIAIYNNMRCAYSIPHSLLYKGFKVDMNSPAGTGASYSKKNILHPGQSVVLDRQLFEAYQKISKPFQAMLSMRNLIVKDDGLVIDNRDYEDAITAQAPKELDGYGSKKLQSIIKEPAKIEIKSSREYTPNNFSG